VGLTINTAGFSKAIDGDKHMGRENHGEWHDQLVGYHGISATFDMMAFNHLIPSD